MVRRRIRGAAGALMLWVVLGCGPASWSAAALGQLPAPPNPPAGTGSAERAPSVEGTAPLDLRSGRVDTTPLIVRREIDDTGAPMMPPQTVEGKMVSLDPSGRVMTVRTESYGDVKVGLPPDLIPLRKGHESTLEAIKPGDRVYATVEATYGVRAVRLVSEPPVNPLLNLVGIPLLLLIALAIWWTGRNRGEVVAERTPPAKATGRS